MLTAETTWGCVPESLEKMRDFGPENPRHIFPSRILATFAFRLKLHLGKRIVIIVQRALVGPYFGVKSKVELKSW